MGQVHRLVAAESAVIDKSVLSKLRTREGDRSCRNKIDQMIFEATDLLCRVEENIKNGESEQAINDAKELILVSSGAGMICLNDVAYDIVDCLLSDNRIATHAVLARLLRLGEESLFALIDYTEQTLN